MEAKFEPANTEWYQVALILQAEGGLAKVFNFLLLDDLFRVDKE